MKQLLTFTFPLFIALTIQAQTSTITGNVMVTFNYINNKADAGADVRLWNISKSYKNDFGFVKTDSVISTTCDISGNFTLKNIPAGEYILYVSSKSTIADPFNIYNNLVNSLVDPIKTMTGFDIEAHKPELRKQIDDLFNESIELSKEKKFKKYEKVNKDMNQKIDEFISSFPGGVKLFLDFFNGKTTQKEFKRITVKQGVDENYAIKFDQKY